MPICEEPVERVFAGLRALHRSLERAGALEHFDFFVLSDSTVASTVVEEEVAWASWCRELNGWGRIFYRRRKVRTAKKAGNVADFCRRWGRLYRYMVVFDADSVMSGEALVRMVTLMAPAAIGIAAALAAAALGTLVGLTAGYLGGRWDNLVSRVMDVFFSVPGLLLSIGIAAMRGPGVNSAVIAIAIVYTPIFARIMRGPVLVEREKEYVEAVRALGAGRVKVALRHVLPNVLSPFVVQGTVAFSQAILIEASLSYLGLSAQPPTPSWGNMLNEGRTYLETAPWISVFPGLAIMTAVLAFNLLGDGLRDVLDPRSQ